MPITPEDVLAARTDLSQLGLNVANDFFSVTWQASHVHFVELAPSSQASQALLLAYALTKSPVSEIPLEQWLLNTRFQPGTVDAVAQLVAHATSDLKDKDPGANATLVAVLNDLPLREARFIHVIEAGAALRRPSSPYNYGATFHMFWENASQFYFLEVHKES